MAEAKSNNETQQLTSIIQEVLHFLSPLIAPLAQHIADKDTKALGVVDRLRRGNKELQQRHSNLEVGSPAAVLVDKITAQFLSQMLVPLTAYIDGGKIEEALKIVEKIRLMASGLRQYCSTLYSTFGQTPINLKEVLESAVYCLLGDQILERKGVKIEVDPKLSTLIIYEKYEGSLRSAIGDILENVIAVIGVDQFSLPTFDQPLLDISFKQTNGQVQITYSYQGPAINVKDLQPNFPPVVKDQASQLALNLLCAKIIIERQGSTIEVQPEAEGKIKVLVALPVKQEE